jgi:hypothetical protein
MPAVEPKIALNKSSFKTFLQNAKPEQSGFLHFYAQHACEVSSHRQRLSVPFNPLIIFLGTNFHEFLDKRFLI